MTRRHRVDRSKECNRAADFWGFHNKAWVRSTPIPASESRITQAYFIAQEIDRELTTVIQQSKTTNPTENIASLLASWGTTEGGVPADLTPLLQLMTIGVRNPSDVAARIGYMNRYGMSAPISIYIQGDKRDHRRCRVFIEEGAPNIGIPEYWLWSENSPHRAAYRTYVHQLATHLHEPLMTAGLTAEREFAGILTPATDADEDGENTVLSWSDLNREYSTIDWSAMFTAWGLPTDHMHSMSYYVASRPFLHHMQKRFHSWSLDQWRGWLALIVGQWISGLCPPGPLRTAWFAYNRRHMQGIAADISPERLRTSIVKTLLPNTLGRLWVRNHCRSEMKRAIGDMVKHIRAAAATILSRTAWMAPSTRAAAVKKLQHMDVEICWPEHWISSEFAYNLTPKNYVHNLLTVAAATTDSNINLGDCRRPHGDGWPVPVFEVNAFYYPDENRVIIPAAILRPPFYDPTQSAPSNYGAIGATIGHELCHAFDSDGRRYDANGDVRSWWNRRDAAEFRTRASRMVRIFQTRKHRKMSVDGRLTLVENIADLGGLEFALAGARHALGRTLTKGELREFFESYAISWRSKVRARRATELLTRDPHAPPPLRVNNIVRQMDEWYAAYDVGPDCPGYIAPEHRLHMFGSLGAA